MYKQVLLSEHGGKLELAAIGYRASLEIQVKDYAIKELKEPLEEVEKKLCLLQLVIIFIKQI